MDDDYDNDDDGNHQHENYNDVHNFRVINYFWVITEVGIVLPPPIWEKITTFSCFS